MKFALGLLGICVVTWVTSSPIYLSVSIDVINAVSADVGQLSKGNNGQGSSTDQQGRNVKIFTVSFSVPLTHKVGIYLLLAV